ncbi:MAG: hypothetical protein U0169_08120 [Polyangiaceae bacterium]
MNLRTAFRTSAAVFAAAFVSLHASDARAQSAEKYASGGLNLLQGGELLTGPQFTGVAAGSPTIGFLGLWVHGRYVLPQNRISIEGNFGLGIDGLAGTKVTFTPGVGAGYVIPINDTMAFTPTFRMRMQYTTVSPGGDQFLFSPTVDAPLALFISDTAFIEPYATLGAMFNTSVGQAYFVLGGGYRLGIHF